jgi:hypothetical protein
MPIYMRRVGKKCTVYGGPDFGPEDEGKFAVIVRAQYGLKSSGAAWRAHLAERMVDIGFTSCLADPDVWLRPAVKSDGTNIFLLSKVSLPASLITVAPWVSSQTPSLQDILLAVSDQEEENNEDEVVMATTIGGIFSPFILVLLLGCVAMCGIIRIKNEDETQCPASPLRSIWCPETNVDLLRT